MRVQTEHWPLFALAVHTPRLSLRYPDDDDVVALADLGVAGVHDPSFMPFFIPWTDQEPRVRARSSVQFLWRQRAEWTAEHWSLPMAVVVDGRVVGLQDLIGEHFPVLRVVRTGSWLGQPYQAKGIGTEMRHAILHLAFAGLGAREARSAAFADNHASLGVSRKVGYERCDTRTVLRRGEAAPSIELRMTRETWEARRRDDISIENLEPCLAMFGLA